LDARQVTHPDGRSLAAAVIVRQYGIMCRFETRFGLGANMMFMVIERFRDGDVIPIYRRLREGGRSLPDGLEYVDSWIEPNFARCFQLMRCDDLRLFQEWVLQWRGFGATFEIVPVVPSKETREVAAPYLDAAAEESN
jgi:hypothetical protein